LGADLPDRGRASLLILEESFTKEEVRGALFSLGSDKASRTDGFNMRFINIFDRCSGRILSIYSKLFSLEI